MTQTMPENAEDGSLPRRRGGILAQAACIFFLFTVSGSAGLIYEVCWKHVFTTVFGSTTYAVSVVISVF
ncbi:MAG: hypothetical protein ACYS1C_11560, partial [Planctomycetota bacterium]